MQTVLLVKEREFTEIFTMLIPVEQYREQQLRFQQQQPAECNVRFSIQAIMAGVVQNLEAQQLIRAVIIISPGLTVLTVLLTAAGAILLLGN